MCRAVSVIELRYESSQLILYKVKVSACFEIRAKHVTQCEHRVELLNVKPGGK